MKALLLLLLLSGPLFARDYYVSDGLANKLQTAESEEDHNWILSVEKDENRTTEILYKNQEIHKTWVKELILSEGQFEQRENYYFKDVLRSFSVFNLKDQLLEEVLYDSSGGFMVKNKYIYDDEGLLTAIESRNQDDELNSSYDLNYRLNGSLRSLDGETGDRVEWRSSDFNNRFLDALYIKEDEIRSVYRYENERLMNRQVESEGQTIERSTYSYDSEGRLNKEEYVQEDGSRIVRFYNPDGELLVQNRYKEGILLFSLVQTFAQGKLIRRQERSGRNRLIWVYEYNEGENEPYLTRHYRNGVLLKEELKTEDGIQESIYRNDTVVLTRIIEEDDS